MSTARRRLGARGEDLAADWYRSRGYEVVDRNWRTREGEIDLVVRSGRTYVFCEVKTRTGVAFGLPAEAVTPAKQRRLRRLALQWLQQRPGPAADIRFDVAAVTGPRDVEVLEGAF